MHKNDYAQPIKLYLRYKDLRNRIIAMPAYLGGSVSTSGIKWIASFPGNIQNGLPRAHSVSILSNPDTGVPFCLMHTNLVSAIRTAAVSGLMIMKYMETRVAGPVTIGVVGLGQIGRIHLEMIASILGDRIGRLNLYDIRETPGLVVPDRLQGKVSLRHSWQEVYVDADILITCTVSDKPYIDMIPKKGSLQLNVSLRDYLPSIRKHIDVMVVDDWKEVCRENTDIEKMHLEMGLQESDTLSLQQVFVENPMPWKQGDTIMFNPMGMAIFDVAVGAWYYQQTKALGRGVLLAD
jgi:ornithine cyclodeaminase